MSREFDAMLLQEMQRDDFLDIASDDNNAIDAFYPCEDEEYCKDVLQDIDLDEDVEAQYAADKEFLELIDDPIQEVIDDEY